MTEEIPKAEPTPENSLLVARAMRESAMGDAPRPPAVDSVPPVPGTPSAVEEAEQLAAPAIKPGMKVINLALQGGGAHGAYTWGVLDRLMEEDRIAIEGISATSAGAMNAAAFKSGFSDGGNEGARAALDTLWTEIGDMGKANINPFLEWVKWFNPSVENLASAIEASPSKFLSGYLGMMFSPYDNPFDENPLRRLLERKLDFGAVCETCAPHLFIATTNVRTGKIRVFRNSEVTPSVIVASACLPTVFRAVEIDDPRSGKKEAFWDGGFVGNPALFPLFYETQSRDVVIVHINPMERPEIPRTAAEIEARTNEISFNASLMFELRAIDFVRRLIEVGAVKRGDMKDVLIHSVKDDVIMQKLGGSTKVNPEPLLLEKLKEAGRRSMDTFLTEHWADIGVRPTVNLRAMFS